MSHRVLAAIALVWAGCSPDPDLPSDSGGGLAPASRVLSGENSNPECTDASDNDSDGARNCVDSECQSHCASACAGGTAPVDTDVDGYYACATAPALSGQDCNDADAFVHPTGTVGDAIFPDLPCNGVDDNCGGNGDLTTHATDVATGAVGPNVATVANVCTLANDYWNTCSTDGDIRGDWAIAFTPPATGTYRFSSSNPDLTIGLLPSTCPYTSELDCVNGGQTLTEILTAGVVVHVILELDSGACTTEAGDLDICKDIDLDGFCSDVDSNDNSANACNDTDGDTCDDCTNGSDNPANDGADSDGDGRCDLIETDDDNDGVLDGVDTNRTNPLVCQDTENAGVGDGCDDCAVTRNPPSSTNDGTDSDSDGLCNAGDPDDDNDGVADGSDSAPTNALLCQDLDSDTCNDCAVTRNPPSTSNDGTDTDTDGDCDAHDPDDDDDGVGDAVDRNRTNPNVCQDSDADNCDDCTVNGAPTPNDDGPDNDADGDCDAHDPDDDDDAVLDGPDPDDFDDHVCGDSDLDTCDDCVNGPPSDPSDDGLDGDGDGKCDAGDTDADNDGVNDPQDPAPNDPSICDDSDDDTCDDCDVANVFSPANDGTDTDGDGDCDAGDPDDDDDTVLDVDDSDDLDPSRCEDSDADGCDDCSVNDAPTPDDDGPDSDGDGACDANDDDDDNDGVDDAVDRDPDDPFRCADSDADSCDDCSVLGTTDPDDDGLDTDLDGACNVGDGDDDDDGSPDGSDRAPLDPNLCTDADSDSCDDCSQTRRPPSTANDGTDTNGDGICDLTDDDDDGDTVLDGVDVVPTDRFRCTDGDSDGCDDCSTAGFPSPSTDGADLDRDGTCDAADTDDDADLVDDGADPDPNDNFVCGDSDADGCDDCSVAGRLAPSNDGTDTDADGDCDPSDPDDDGDSVLDADDGAPLDRLRCVDGDTDGCDDCAVNGTPTPDDDGLDVDGDGWCATGDCLDADPLSFPGQAWLPDCDGDTFHRATDAVVACSAAAAQTVPTGPCPGSARSWAVTVATADCDDTDAAEFPGQLWYPDCDGDGVTTSAFAACALVDADTTDPCGDGATPDGGYTHALPPILDCDDANDAVSPTYVDGAGATVPRPESCEPVGSAQVDSDCNGDVNTEGTPPEPASVDIRTLYVDQDLDGFGDPNRSIDGCEVLAGLSVSAGDCNDSRADIHLGAPEICDGEDQNCNGLSDEADFLAEADSLCVDLYRDRDGDGYGDVGATHCLCTDESLTATFDNERYVATFSDCDDLHADLLPHECNDGTDNDDDGEVDAFDPDCAVVTLANGQQRRPSKEGGGNDYVVERVDGHDNQCDGIVPIFELDCDDDGSFPALQHTNPAGDVRSVDVFDASDVGLQPCTGGPIQIACWGDVLAAECDEVTGLWGIRYGSSEDGFGGRFQGGHRELASVGCDPVDDCDDQCPSRCPGQVETCDGVDDDCSGVAFGSDGDGVPDALDAALAKGGTVDASELDLDGDAHAACTEDFREGAEELQAQVSTCQPFVEEFPTSDCDDLCYLANDLGVEACNDFVDLCGGEREARDLDGDGRSTCGAATANVALYEEQAFVPVLVTGGDPPYVPLVPPRERSTTCDGPLRDALEASGADLAVDGTSEALVDALCVTDPLTPGVFPCTVVVLRITADQPDLVAQAKVAAESGSLPADCATDEIELSLRTTWDHDRLADARAGVIELECLRMFGKPCDALGAADPAIARGAPTDIDGLLGAEGAPFWVEIGRFSPFTADGAVMGCWGDPRTAEPSMVTGGDCSDGQTGANRDAAEGPDDLVAVWLGDAGDCGRCNDGVDNNCDGLSDCADPTCDVCFVGQGRGCSGLRDACATDDGGCAVLPAADPTSPLFPALALAVGLLRRRPRR